MTPQEKKTALYVGGGVLLVGIGYLVFFNKSDTAGAYLDPTGNGTVLNPTTSSFNAKNIADNLYNAMRESGTDEDVIISELKNVSQPQFALIVKSFGRKQYNDTTGNQYNYIPFTQLPLVDLKGWLKSELSLQEYTNLRRKYPQYL